MPNHDFMIITLTGDDFTLESAVINFPAGETTASVTVTTIDDAVAELTESFEVTLSNPSQGLAIGADNTASVTIIDNDSNFYLKSEIGHCILLLLSFF